MEMQNTFSQLNWPAIFAAAISTFLIGGSWYSLFEKQWMATNGFTREFLKQRKLPIVFGLSFIFFIHHGAQPCTFYWERRWFFRGNGGIYDRLWVDIFRNWYNCIIRKKALKLCID